MQWALWCRRLVKHCGLREHPLRIEINDRVEAWIEPLDLLNMSLRELFH
jgi:hypothetical protein